MPGRPRPTVLGAARRHLGRVLLVVMLSGIAGYAVTATTPTRYRAEARIFLVPKAWDEVIGGSVANAGRFFGQQAAILATPSVQEAARRALAGQPSPRDKPLISVVPHAEQTYVSVVVNSSDPRQAQRLANAIVAAYQDTLRRSLEQSLDGVRRVTTNPLAIRQAELTIGARRNGVSLVQQASLPTAPSKPGAARTAVVVAALGALVAATVAYVRELSRPGRPA